MRPQINLKIMTNILVLRLYTKSKLGLEVMKSLREHISTFIEELVKDDKNSIDAFDRLYDHTIKIGRKTFMIRPELYTIDVNKFDITSKREKISEKEVRLIKNGVKAKIENGMPVILVIPYYYDIVGLKI